MAFSSVTITRSDIDSAEGSTLQYHSSGTTLGLSEHDDDVLSNAKNELELDLSEKAQHLVNDEVYANATAALDALADVDDNNMLKQLLLYKFLELFFNDDASTPESGQAQKARQYEGKYFHYLDRTVDHLMSKLDPPQRNRSYRAMHGYG